MVEAEDKRRARVNMIAHLLSTVPYYEVQLPVLKLPARPPATNYIRPPRELFRSVPDRASMLEVLKGGRAPILCGLARADACGRTRSARPTDLVPPGVAGCAHSTALRCHPCPETSPVTDVPRLDTRANT